MTQNQFQRAGMILFGEHWKMPLANTFSLNARSVRRMANGDIPIPDGLAQDIETALRDHGQKLDELLEEFI